MEYTVYALDVWAGEEDGEWLKNDYFDIGTINLCVEQDNCSVLQQIVDAGYLKADAMPDLEIANWDCEGIYFEVSLKQDAMPVLDFKRKHREE